jgi:hypothetical protein
MPLFQFNKHNHQRQAICRQKNPILTSQHVLSRMTINGKLNSTVQNKIAGFTSHSHSSFVIICSYVCIFEPVNALMLSISNINSRQYSRQPQGLNSTVITTRVTCRAFYNHKGLLINYTSNVLKLNTYSAFSM